MVIFCIKPSQLRWWIIADIFHREELYLARIETVTTKCVNQLNDICWRARDLVAETNIQTKGRVDEGVKQHLKKNWVRAKKEIFTFCRRVVAVLIIDKSELNEEVYNYSSKGGFELNAISSYGGSWRK